jgi:hypothetical protein
MSSKVMDTKQASCWESHYIQKSESSELGPWVPGVHQPRGGERARANAMTGLAAEKLRPTTCTTPSFQHTWRRAHPNVIK